MLEEKKTRVRDDPASFFLSAVDQEVLEFTFISPFLPAVFQEDMGTKTENYEDEGHESEDELRQHFQERDYSVPYPLPIERIISDFPSFTERYFEPFFFVPMKAAAEIKQAGDQVVLFHSNRLVFP